MQTWLREQSCDLYLSFFLYKNWTRDCPGGPAVEHLPCNAGDVGSIPGLGTKTPHATERQSPCSTITEPAHSGALTLKQESPSMAVKTGCSQINKYIFKNWANSPGSYIAPL